ncbi:MAG: DUF1127 domain-containing protein [Pseudomonadota bacterium]
MTRDLQLHALNLLNASPRLPLLAVLAVSFAAAVTRWQIRRRTRINLSQLDDRLLTDIGLSRRQARRESSLPFWRV